MSSFLPALGTQVLTACWNKGVSIQKKQKKKHNSAKKCWVHSCEEKNKERLSVAAAATAAATAGIARRCSLMLANVFTAADSGDGAVVSSSARPGPHTPNVGWGGMLLLFFFFLFFFFWGGLEGGKGNSTSVCVLRR